jgi:hypothetical protein
MVDGGRADRADVMVMPLPGVRRRDVVRGLVARRGVPRAIVTLANKNARIIWALLAREQDYRRAA